MLADLEALVPPLIVAGFFVALVRAILRVQNPQRRAAARAREKAAEAADPRISRTPMYSPVPAARGAQRTGNPGRAGTRVPNRTGGRPAPGAAAPRKAAPKGAAVQGASSQNLASKRSAGKTADGEPARRPAPAPEVAPAPAVSDQAAGPAADQAL
jgi:hypothetical protein